MKLPQKAKIWNENFRGGGMARRKFYEGLIYCARFEPVEEILSVLEPEERKRFEEIVKANSDVEDNSEFIRIGDPPDWGVEEIQKFAEVFGFSKE